MVTLHHFTNPLWFVRSKIGGWESKYAPDYFEEYTKRVVEEFADLVDYWITINEPMVYALSSYLVGYWPPEKRSPVAARRVIKNLVLAHQKAYRAIHQIYKKRDKKPIVGIAKSNWFLEPYRKYNPLDIILTKFCKHYQNDYFLMKIRNDLDFIGLNYFRSARIKFDLRKQLLLARSKEAEVSDLGWEINPAGIGHVLHDIKKYEKPIFITENGLADTADTKRSSFILLHLKEIYEAIESGIDVRGYFHWSLMDNFEWREGFEPRFGLVEIDYETMDRKPRPSAYMYGEICKANGISEELVERYEPLLLEEIFG
jgi:beta-glucosidase